MIALLARPGLPTFEYVRATTPAHVFQHLRAGDARLFMGGTDLLTQMRDGKLHPRVVVDIKHVDGMQDITLDDDGLKVGAAVTMNQLALHPQVQSRYPTLAQAARSVGSFQLRNRATLGGNLCNASPCADTSPAVLALQAEMHLMSPAGRRVITAQTFFRGPGSTAVRHDEFLAAVTFPPPVPGTTGCYLKLGRNRLGDLSVVGVAVCGFPDQSVKSGFRFHIALGSVAPVPIRVLRAEELLTNLPPGRDTFLAAGKIAQDTAAPISDVRAGAEYQKQMVQVLTMRALQSVWERLGERDSSLPEGE